MIAPLRALSEAELFLKNPCTRSYMLSLKVHSHITNYIFVHRGSYVSAQVLLNLLNELGKRAKRRGLPSILSLFRNEFNKFLNSTARMIDYIYHTCMSLKLLESYLGVKTSDFPSLRDVIMDVMMLRY